MLLQRLATGATGVKQARYRRGPTRGLYGGVMVWGLYSGVNVWGRYGGANVWGENQNTLSIYISIRMYLGMYIPWNMHKVRIRTILGISCANLGSELCAGQQKQLGQGGHKQGSEIQGLRGSYCANLGAFVWSSQAS